MKVLIKKSIIFLGWLIFFVEVSQYFETRTHLGIVGIWGMITLIIILNQFISIRKVEKAYKIKHQEVQATEGSRSILSLATISDTQFKELVLYIFYKQGYTVIRNKGEESIVIEMGKTETEVRMCYSSEQVKEKTIRDIVLSKDDEDTKKQMFISNQAFSPQAVCYANENNISLMGRKEIESIGLNVASNIKESI